MDKQEVKETLEQMQNDYGAAITWLMAGDIKAAMPFWLSMQQGYMKLLLA